MVILTAASLWAGNAFPADTARKIALVIGNSDYIDLPKLRNPRNDAQLMVATLRGIGFETSEAVDLNRQALTDRIRAFTFALRPGDIAVFYYAGHAVQVDGRNYLLPVDAAISSEKEVAAKGFRIDDMLDKTAKIDDTIKLVILDACRDNPFALRTRSAGTNDEEASRGGLARMETPPGSSNFYIAYSTAPGNRAYDGTGLNSPYTAALAQELKRPNLSISTVFNNVRNTVIKATGINGRSPQIPWESTSLTADLVLVSQEVASSIPPQSRPQTSPQLPPKVTKREPAPSPESTAKLVNPQSPPVPPKREGQQRTAAEWYELLNQIEDKITAIAPEELPAMIRKADRGDPLAQTVMANLYREGKVVARDYLKSSRYYRAAAKQRFAIAQHQLARYSVEGGVVAKNLPFAIELYEDALSQNYSPSLWNLGMLYTQGIGVPQDQVKGRDMMERAAKDSPFLTSSPWGVSVTPQSAK